MTPEDAVRESERAVWVQYGLAFEERFVKSVGAGWSALEAEAMFRLGRLPNFRASWRTLLGRYLRLTGTNADLRITAEQLRRVPQPTLFLWGSGDPFGSPEIGRAAVKIMPDARLEVVGVGHLPWWDDRDTCARKIRAFVPERN